MAIAAINNYQNENDVSQDELKKLANMIKYIWIGYHIKSAHKSVLDGNHYTGLQDPLIISKLMNVPRSYIFSYMFTGWCICMLYST